MLLHRMMSAAVYVRIARDRMRLRKVGSGDDIDVLPAAPFTTTRLLVGEFAAAQAALAHLNPHGSITFVAAVSAHSAAPGTAGIGAQNAAVAALVPILAAELKPLRVNGISPGLIDTPWWDFLPEEERRSVFSEYAQKTPVGRVGRAEEVARAICLLVENNFMTGHVLLCDGGLRWAA